MRAYFHAMSSLQQRLEISCFLSAETRRSWVSRRRGSRFLSPIRRISTIRAKERAHDELVARCIVVQVAVNDRDTSHMTPSRAIKVGGLAVAWMYSRDRHVLRRMGEYVGGCGPPGLEVGRSMRLAAGHSEVIIRHTTAMARSIGRRDLC